MIDETQRERAALYALDALPADESARFRDSVRQNPDLAELVAAYELAAQSFAEGLPPVEPPAGLRDRVIAAVKPPAASRRSGAAMAGIGWGVAAGLAIAAGTLAWQNHQLTTERTALTQRASEVEPLRVELASARDQASRLERQAGDLRRQVTALEERNALAAMQVATLTSQRDASFLASIAWDNATQEGILQVRRLPAPGSDKEYQLWIFQPADPTPISAGVFRVEPDGSATIRFAPASKVSRPMRFAVSVEQNGGSPAPTGPVVLSN